MYSSNRSSRGYRGSSSSSRPSFSGRPSRGARPIKRLDSRLFVNKGKSASTPVHIPEVTNQFSDFDFLPIIQRNIQVKGYTTPTPIQDQTIPAIIEGRDVIGVANTGTGKTAAFLLPLMQMIIKNRETKVLIVTPTRELALQIQDELRSFSPGLGIYSVLAIGGASLERQRSELRRGAHVVIGTPGRLKDLIQQRALRLEFFSKIVLDEVDRMVDIGFIKDVQYLVSLLPPVRQSLFFTATITPKVEEILHAFVKNPVKVSVKTQATAETIDQDVIRIVDKSQKIDILHNLLIQDEYEKVIVFGRTKWGIEKLHQILVERGHRVDAIHGNKSQGQRQRALRSFKNNQIRVLLATDVASRGIDVEDVTHVINYDAPESYDDYVHRIGRTGRANKRGKAITFVD